MIPDVSAGSNHVGASETCTAQVICPSGAASAETAPLRTARATKRMRPALAMAVSGDGCREPGTACGRLYIVPVLSARRSRPARLPSGDLDRMRQLTSPPTYG